MCGIAGIFAYRDTAARVSREELQRIGERMARRGPDGKGEWISDDYRMALGHRRLSIIDLSARGTQPMCSADGRIVISFNGEIYNYRALRHRLEQEGAVFRSGSDTEVLIHLYRSKAEAMVHELRGMYAFALWDADKQALLLARDPYGIKPLYYADDGQTLRVASQVKALLAGGGVSRDPEPAGIAGFFLFGSVPEPFTTWREIRALPAGSYLWVTRSGPSAPDSFFSVAGVWAAAAQNPQRLDQEELFQRVREAVLDSVRHHLIADVPVGAFLSAGVDSGALVGLVSESAAASSGSGSRSPLATLTLGFAELQGGAGDETAGAEQVAAHYATRHTHRHITQSEFQGDLPRILDAMDQPSIDGINTWLVSKAAKEQGWKVALSGLGGDELFGGYPSFRDIPRWVRALRFPSRVPILGEAFRQCCSVYQSWVSTLVPGPQALSPKFAGLLKYAGTYAGAYLLKRGLFMPWELPQLIGREVAEEGLQRLRPLHHIEEAFHPEPCTPFAKVAALEASLYMRNQLLRDADWAGMDHSLEIRTPLVDAVLLKELAPPLAGAVDLNGKRMLGNSPRRRLPAAILERPKTGFCVPISDWIESTQELDGWRGVPLLRSRHCHWARRFAYAIGAEAA